MYQKLVVDIKKDYIIFFISLAFFKLRQVQSSFVPTMVYKFYNLKLAMALFIIK